MNNTIKKIPFLGVMICILVILLIGFSYVISLRINAKNLGNTVGSDYGTLAGKAVGSYEGLTKGSVDGFESGKEKGLSAEDTTAEIANSMHEINKLEVLVASVKLNDIHSVGDDKDYAALYLLKGEAVFTIDLSKAEIKENNNVINITVPQPKMELTIDQSRIKKVAQYQKLFFNGSAEDGLDAYINSMKKVVDESEKALANYDSLLRTAKIAAEKQIINLVNSVSFREREIHVYFQEPKIGEEDN